jgi:hypothetical protein
MGLFDGLLKMASSTFSYRDKKGRVWFLHEKMSRSGVMLHYFSKDQQDGVAMPDGFFVIESEKTGLPVLKRM